MKKGYILSLCLVLALAAGVGYAALTVPTDIQQPGTQPQEVGNLETPDKCDNCHGGYNLSVEPAFNWRGSMMAGAGRDPIFWATLAIAEQDFDGAGDLCIRCHSTAGWMAGRSTPTDGSGLAAGDADGVECDFCHKMTNPNDRELLGVMNAPFVANDGASNGYYGSGMASLWGGSDKLGPYADAEARHQWLPSNFHRSRDFCGTCHDVSNPAVGDLAHNNGTQATSDPVVSDGTPGNPVDGKAAFNNFPFMYGIVERTFSEHRAGGIDDTLIATYPTLPADLKGGALEAIYQAALDSGTGGNYEDGTDRYFSCQSCHMRPVTGTGCNKRGAPVRKDLPLHDMTGGNYWIPDAIQYLDQQGKLRLGGGLTTVQSAALDAGKLRALEQLKLAASLSVDGHTLKIVNHTGHKLISGYPEGRRMWLNVTWYDAGGNLLREDGAYGSIGVAITNPLDGQSIAIESILDLHDPNTKIYEAHYGMTQEWAQQLLDLGYDPGLPLSFDRVTGAVDYDLGKLNAQAPGTDHETFHFVLNNTVVKDNRIPPYGFSYEAARQRNALPVPADQYSGAPGGTYDYFDEITLNPPSGAKSADIRLMYQPTSWEYIQFLYRANTRQNAFLANEGEYMLEAWLNTGMAAPQVMATATWRDPSSPVCDAVAPTLASAAPGDKQVELTWSAATGATGYHVYYDQAGKSQFIASITGQSSVSFIDANLTNGQEYCYKVTSWNDVDCESTFSNILCAVPVNPGQTVYAGVESLATGKVTTSGKGKNATTVFALTDQFTAGDTVVFQALVTDQAGTPLSGAVVNIEISGPDGPIALITSPSSAAGIAEASWKTQAPNRKGGGGTTPGGYKATVTGLSAAGYAWDQAMTNAAFSIN